MSPLAGRIHRIRQPEERQGLQAWQVITENAEARPNACETTTISHTAKGTPFRTHRNPDMIAAIIHDKGMPPAMKAELPAAGKLKIIQRTSPVRREDIEKLDALILVLPEKTRKSAWPDFPFATLLRRRWQNAHVSKTETAFFTDLPCKRAGRVALFFFESDMTTFALLTQARKLFQAVSGRNPANIGVLAAGLGEDDSSRCLRAMASAAMAADFSLPSFRQQDKKPHHPARMELLGLSKRLDMSRLRAGASGNRLARWLTGLPGNFLPPSRYRSLAEKLAKLHGWQYKFYDEKRLQKLGAGAFLAVSQGSPQHDAGIIHLHYQPPVKTGKPAVALVGKGICYDTGGINLKSAKSMFGMQGDMQGSAVALGTLLALSELEVDFPVDCWLAVAQNHIGSNAYKPNDVIVASTGTSIEVVHTDAEGRMVLADTLAIAGKYKPGLIIDYATLTGACVYSLSSRMSGAFTNRRQLIPVLMEAGEFCGERIWPFPMEADYGQMLTSDVADIKQCTIESEADHILAAHFLARFVDKKIPWVHLDLSAGEHKGGLADIPTDVSGFGVRLSLELLLNRQLMAN